MDFGSEVLLVSKQSLILETLLELMWRRLVEQQGTAGCFINTLNHKNFIVTQRE